MKIENRILKDSTYRRVLKIIDSLDETTQQIIDMRADKDTFIEIAGDLGLSESATKKRFYRARKKIKSVVNQ